MATPQTNKVQLGLDDRTYELAERFVDILQTVLVGNSPTDRSQLEHATVHLAEAIDRAADGLNAIASAIADRQA